MKAIIFSGTRRKSLMPEVFLEATAMFSSVEIMLADIYVGDAKGVDKTVRDYWPDAKVFKADWHRLKKAAGNIRNEAMIAAALEEHDPKDIILLAFPCKRSVGTYNCVKSAGKVGIKSIVTPI